MDELIIKVSLIDCEDGFSFWVYPSDDAYMACDAADGGVCTSTVENAIDMAAEQAKELLRRS